MPKEMLSFSQYYRRDLFSRTSLQGNIYGNSRVLTETDFYNATVAGMDIRFFCSHRSVVFNTTFYPGYF